MRNSKPALATKGGLSQPGLHETQSKGKRGRKKERREGRRECKKKKN